MKTFVLTVLLATLSGGIASAAPYGYRNCANNNSKACRDAREAFGQWDCEKSCAAVEINRRFASLIFYSCGNQLFEQAVIDLKEAFGAEANRVLANHARDFARLPSTQIWRKGRAAIARYSLKLRQLIGERIVLHGRAQARKHRF